MTARISLAQDWFRKDCITQKFDPQEYSECLSPAVLATGSLMRIL